MIDRSIFRSSITDRPAKPMLLQVDKHRRHRPVCGLTNGAGIEIELPSIGRRVCVRHVVGFEIGDRPAGGLLERHIDDALDQPAAVGPPGDRYLAATASGGPRGACARENGMLERSRDNIAKMLHALAKFQITLGETGAIPTDSWRE